MAAPKEGARDNGKGEITCLTPDVCLKQVGNAVAPTPFMSTATLDATAAKTTSTVRLGGDEAYNEASHVTETKGDGPDDKKGIKSGTVGDKVEPLTHSGAVNFEGKPAVRHGDTCYMNNKNTCGELDYPGNKSLEIVEPSIKAQAQLEDAQPNPQPGPAPPANDNSPRPNLRVVPGGTGSPKPPSPKIKWTDLFKLGRLGSVFLNVILPHDAFDFENDPLPFLDQMAVQQGMTVDEYLNQGAELSPENVRESDEEEEREGCEHLEGGDPTSEYRGGSHRGTREAGKHSHHVPSKAANGGAQPPHLDKRPAIQMTPDDHKATRSFAGRNRRYRSLQEPLILSGDIIAAVNMDVLDALSIAEESGEPGKYDEAIRQMWLYTLCLIAIGQVTQTAPTTPIIPPV